GSCVYSRAAQGWEMLMAELLTGRILLCALAGSVVEDMRRCLEANGCTVTALLLAEGEGEGEGQPNLTGVRLVVVDGTSGAAEALRLCRRLRSRSRESDGFTPLLFVTANPAPAARLASLEAGADAYLLRPFEPAELLAQVRAL